MAEQAAKLTPAQKRQPRFRLRLKPPAKSESQPASYTGMHFPTFTYDDTKLFSARKKSSMILTEFFREAVDGKHR